MANHPIFYPVFHGDVAAVRKLLKADPDLVNVRNAKKLTPLQVAASRGQDKVIQLLLDFGADIAEAEPDAWPPLVFACYRGHLAAVKVLIKNGAGVTEADGNPIHFSGQRKHREICKLLVENGAVDDLVATSKSELLKVFRASYSYDHETLEGILQRHPELVNGRDRHGRIALHEASTHGDVKSVRVMLRYGADLNAVDDRGQTPLDRARAHRQHSIVKLLEKQNAKTGG